MRIASAWEPGFPAAGSSTHMNRIEFRQPDDWHVHLRDGDLLRAVLPFTARAFARAIVMPNLGPPVARAADASAYRRRILAALPQGTDFTPLMTCYLMDQTDAADLAAGGADGVFTAAKLYPAHATTNASHGVTRIEAVHGVLAAMERIGMPLLVHGESTRPDVDVFDREKVFIDETLTPLLARFPGLKIVMEHVTTEDGVAIVRAHPGRLAATLTPQHLLFNRNALFHGGLRPHMYCLPVLKREKHRLALRAAATSGEPGFFLGTDTAPHLRAFKETGCGCAGVFSAPVAVEAYLSVFDEEGALDRFEAFASLNGPKFYGLPPNERRVAYERRRRSVAEATPVGPQGDIAPLFAGGSVDWARAPES
jgi:dihydroorotase